MRFVLQTVKNAAPPAAQAKQPTPHTATAASQPQPPATKQSVTATKQSVTATKPPAAIATLVAHKPATAAVVSTAKPAALNRAPAAAVEQETKEAVAEVRLRFDSTYSQGADSSAREVDRSEYDEDEQDQYGDDEDEAELGAPSVAINCSYSINPTSALQRSHHFRQADDDDDERTIEEDEEEDDNGTEENQLEDEEEKEQYEEEEDEAHEAAAEEAPEDEEEAEQETELHNFVAVDESVTHILHSRTAPVDSDNNNNDNSGDEQDEADDDTPQLHAFQPHAFQPHSFHIQPAQHADEKDGDGGQHEHDEEEVQEAYDEEEEDGVSELCTVQIHQHSLVTQAGHSQSHWHAVDTPTRIHHTSQYTHATSTPTQHTQTASFTLNDSADDISPAALSTDNSPSKPSRLPHEAVEWDEAAHEARVAALQVELKERVEARRRRLRRASYMEEMEEKRLQKELEAKQRALQQLRLLRVKQEAQEKLAALALQKQQQREAEERDRRDKENQQLPPTQQQKRQSTDNRSRQPQPSHTRTPSSVVMRKRIKQAHYDRLLKAVERGDTFTKYYDSWYCKPKPKFVRVVCLSSSGGSVAPKAGQSSEVGTGSMKLTWGSDMFNMDKSLDLSSVVKVQRGSECAVASKLPVQLHSRAFSLSTAEGRTLHLVAPTQAAREVWLSFVLLIVERNRQPLVELNVVAGDVKAADDKQTSIDGTDAGGFSGRMRRSMGGRLSVGRLSLGRLSLGGKTNNGQ